MAKIEKKSIADLVSSRPKRPSPEEIDNITQQIHAPVAPQVTVPKEEPKPVVAEPIVVMEIEEEEKVIALDQMTQTKRISVNASIPLYIKAKTKATMQGKTLMAYIIHLMEKDVKGM
jgi:FtsZ-interacting cell division protein ZipA